MLGTPVRCRARARARARVCVCVLCVSEVWSADAVGWVMFFVLTAAWTLPAAALLVFVAFRGPPGARGEEKFAERETVEAE